MIDYNSQILEKKPESKPPAPVSPPPSPDPALDDSLASVMVPGFKSSTPPMFYPTQTFEQEVYAHPPGVSVPVPSREQIGLPPADTRTYDQKMEALYGPLPPPQKYAEDWRTPEAKAAVGAFRSALLANFTASAAAGGNALSLFFQSNPYAYMLGQSYDMVEDQLQAIAAKNGGTDHVAAQYMTTDNLLNTMELINGIRMERVTGQWPKGSNKEFLMGEFKQRLDSINVRGRQALIASASALVQEDPTLINALANKSSAAASQLSAETQRRSQDLESQKYKDTGKQENLAKTELLQAQAREAQERARALNAVYPLLFRSETAKIDHAKAETALLNMQTREGPVKVLMQADANRQDSLFKALSAAHVVTENAYADYVKTTTDVFNLEQRQQTNTPAYSAAMARRAAAEKMYDDKRRIESDMAQRMQDRVMTDTSRTYTMTNFLPQAIKNNNYNYASVAQNVANTLTDNVSSSLFFPVTPMKWSDDFFTFVPDRDIDAADTLPPAVVTSYYAEVRNNPSLMALVKAGDYMPIDNWIEKHGSPKGYRHYVSIMNHIRQTDFLLSEYKKALDQNTPWEVYYQNHDISKDAIKPNMTPKSSPRNSTNRSKK